MEDSNTDSKKKWPAFFVICLGTLMIVLDTTIVNIALPSIKEDLGFDNVTLAWIVNAYLLTFGGFLILSGRLGDKYGHRKLFLIGIIVFTLSSLLCGISSSQGLLIAARAVQGFGGAIVSAVGLSLTMGLFIKPKERSKAMGIFGFVAAGGGSLGVLLGGFLTSILSWHWIFLVNIPIGLIVILLTINILPKSQETIHKPRLDYMGALTITLALMIAVFAIINGNSYGWTNTLIVSLLVISIILHISFMYIESKVNSPLVDLKTIRIRNVAISNVVGVLWAAGMFSWFFLTALFMQLVLGYSPLYIGLSFLPSNIIMAIFSIGLSARLINRYGIKKTLSTGLFLASLGLVLLSFAPVESSFLKNILPAMLLLGMGAGMAFNPLILAAMSSVKQEDSGLASGLVNTSFMMGGAIGLAILASVASFVTKSLMLKGLSQANALTGGYHIAFIIGAGFVLVGSLLSAIFLKIDDKIYSE